MFINKAKQIIVDELTLLILYLQTNTTAKLKYDDPEPDQWNKHRFCTIRFFSGFPKEDCVKIYKLTNKQHTYFI